MLVRMMVNTFVKISDKDDHKMTFFDTAFKWTLNKVSVDLQLKVE